MLISSPLLAVAAAQYYQFSVFIRLDDSTEMDSSVDQWLQELEKDDLGELEFMDPLSMQQLTESLADELWSQPPQPEEQNPSQQCSYGSPSMSSPGFSFVTAGSGSGNNILSFTTDDGSSSSTTVGIIGNRCRPLTVTEKKGSGRRRASLSVKEHVVAERKRRENMHHQFATLASIVPDITKTDKVSVLDSTIEYVHHLEDRLKTLQEENPNFTGGGGASTAESQCCKDSNEAFKPERSTIEVDVRGRTILLRVVCREKKGVLIMLLTELEKHGLAIINTNVLPFAESSLNITVTAQIEDRTFITGELVNSLNSALQKL